MGSLGGVNENKSGRSSTKLPPPTEEEQAVTEALVDAVSSQLGAIQQQVEVQRQLFESFPNLFTQAEQAAEATSAIPEITDEERRLVEEQVQEQLELGETDITRFRDEGLRQIRDVLAPSRGLFTEDSPILNAAADVVQEAQIQQGQLGRSLRSQGIDRLFDRQLLRAELAQNAFRNRLNLAGSAGSIGLGLNPNVNIPQALGVLQQPRLAQATTKFRQNTDRLSGGFTLSYGGTSGSGEIGGYTPV